MEIRELTDESERREAVPILRQLWSDAASDDVLEWTADDEYHLFGAFVKDEIVGVAGVLVKQILTILATHGSTTLLWTNPRENTDMELHS